MNLNKNILKTYWVLNPVLKCQVRLTGQYLPLHRRCSSLFVLRPVGSRRLCFYNHTQSYLCRHCQTGGRQKPREGKVSFPYEMFFSNGESTTDPYIYAITRRTFKVCCYNRCCRVNCERKTTSISLMKYQFFFSVPYLYLICVVYI